MKLTSDIIAGFVNSILAKNYDNATAVAEFHKEWWDLCCSDSPNVAIAAPRQHSKSTSITHAYTLASVLFREAKYVLIVSDTEGQAVNFLSQIKNELSENEDLKAFFHVQKFVKDRETEIIVEFSDGEQFRIEVKGAEQKVRGLTWRNTRPDLIICDDLENDEIVMNKERREKFRHWFMNALMQCRSSTGKIRLVGTVLHMDSLLERLLPKPWIKSTINDGLRCKFGKDGKGPGGWLAVRYRAHTDYFDKILWKDRYSKQWFDDIRHTYVSQGYPEGYTQEYLNIPIDESSAYFKRGDFIPMTPEDFAKNKRYYIATDLAISESDRADYTVFAIVGVDETGILHVEDIIRERLDASEIVNTILALTKRYNPDLFGIEAGAIQKSIGPFLKDQMLKTGVFPNLLELKTGNQDKPLRARSIQARLRAGGIKFNKESDWYQALEDEMARFPRDVHDDQVDALAWIGLMLDKFVEAQTVEELEEEEWEEEFARNNEETGDSGRNRWTGY